ncbi:hypothetical protein ACFQ60_02620 [Streptomyces zhihengii]
MRAARPESAGHDGAGQLSLPAGARPRRLYRARRPVLLLSGDAGHAHRATLEAAFAAVWDTGRRLVVDVTQLAYAGETLQGLLLTTRTRTGLVLAGTPPSVL